MATEQYITQVQLKTDYTQTALISSASPSSPLPPSSIRLQTKILTLSINNLSYARLGSVLHWWDVFPVSASFPAPHSDPSTYGICPGWGYATVLDSTVPSLPAGATLFGFLPLSTLPFDISVEPAAARGHFIATSPHRAAAMPYYQRYMLAANLDPANESDCEAMALDLTAVVSEAAYLLNRYCLSSSSFSSAGKPIHPLGENIPWTAADADLSAAVAVFLGASSRTALCLAAEMRAHRKPGDGPLGVVGVTSAGDSRAFVEGSGLYDGVLAYDEALGAGEDGESALVGLVSKLGGQRAKRVVLLDFGARGAFAPDAYSALKDGSRWNVTPIRVGGEHKTASSSGGDGASEAAKRLEAMNMVPMNASGIREQAIREYGEQMYFDEMAASKKDLLKDGGIKGLQVKWGEGMKGENGLEGFWKTITEGKIRASEAFVLRL